ncbi:hypothetical protein ACJZ2D_015233 [Fusarium nematophilum]
MPCRLSGLEAAGLDSTRLDSLHTLDIEPSPNASPPCVEARSGFMACPGPPLPVIFPRLQQPQTPDPDPRRRGRYRVPPPLSKLGQLRPPPLAQLRTADAPRFATSMIATRKVHPSAPFQAFPLILSTVSACCKSSEAAVAVLCWTPYHSTFKARESISRDSWLSQKQSAHGADGKCLTILRPSHYTILARNVPMLLTFGLTAPPAGPAISNDLSILGDGEPSPRSSAEDDSSLSQFGASVAFSAEAMNWPTITTPFLDFQSLDCLASFDDASYLPSAISDQDVRKLREVADNNVYEPTRDTARHATSDTSNIGNDQGSGSSSYDGLSLVRDRTEAHLLRHYRQTLAPLVCLLLFRLRHAADTTNSLGTQFDVTDANRHFQLEVTKRASKCQVLLNAIFALAALHLCRTCSFDASVADKYHSRCNSMLDSLLSSEQSVADENLLATVVVLRKYEEMNIMATGKDFERHLVKSAALFNSPTCALGGGLGQTAFWQFVRQDVYLSLPKRAPPRTDISIQPPLTKEAGAPDCVWANRIVWITVCILAYCFAEQPQDAIVWHDLNEKIAQWDREKPPTFDPIYFREPSPQDGCFFPEIWLSDPWHGEWLILAAIPLWTSPADTAGDLATGMQYYHISRLLLALYNPSVGRASAGLDYPRAHWQMQNKAICAIPCEVCVWDRVLKRLRHYALHIMCGYAKLVARGDLVINSIRGGEFEEFSAGAAE